MKYIISGDYHGADLSALIRFIEKEQPDALVNLSDFDQVRTIRQFMELEQQLHSQGREVISVPGNHDHALFFGIDIDSGEIQKQGKNYWQLRQELGQDAKAREYLANLLNSRDPKYTTHRVKTFLDEKRFGKQFPTIVLHGAYKGDLSSFPDCPEDAIDLWIRLRSNDDHISNFAAMARKGYNVMIRGHDHNPAYVYNDSQKGLEGYNPTHDGTSVHYRLFPQRQHTIKPGAFCDGWVAVIDTAIDGEKVPNLMYRNLL